MMSQKVSDYMLARLREWDVETVFAYPGDGINGLLGAFGRADNTPRFVQSRHEEMSAFEAVGYAKFTGRPGVCMATSGPGAIHLLNGLYDAKLDHVPVVAIVGQTARSAMGGSYQQEVDLQALFKDVASEYLVEVNVAEQLPNALDRAIRFAESARAPTAVIVPADLHDPRHEGPVRDADVAEAAGGVEGVAEAGSGRVGRRPGVPSLRLAGDGGGGVTVGGEGPGDRIARIDLQVLRLELEVDHVHEMRGSRGRRHRGKRERQRSRRQEETESHRGKGIRAPPRQGSVPQQEKSRIRARKWGRRM